MMHTRLTSLRLTEEQLARLMDLAARLGVRYQRHRSGLGAVVRALAEADRERPAAVEALLRPHAERPRGTIKIH